MKNSIETIEKMMAEAESLERDYLNGTNLVEIEVIFAMLSNMYECQVILAKLELNGEIDKKIIAPTKANIKYHISTLNHIKRYRIEYDKTLTKIQAETNIIAEDNEIDDTAPKYLSILIIATIISFVLLMLYYLTLVTTVFVSTGASFGAILFAILFAPAIFMAARNC